MNAKQSRYRRLSAWMTAHDWQVVAALWLIVFLLGYAGFCKHMSQLKDERSFWDIIYLTVQLFTLESGSVHLVDNVPLEVARLMAPVTAVYTAVVALALLFHDQFNLIRLRFIANHVVICGLGRRGLLLARRFSEQGDQVVVIERDVTSERVGPCKDFGAIVLMGDGSDDETLRRAGVARARTLVSVCGQDGVNAEIAVDARNLVLDRTSGPLRCVVHIDDLELCHLLKGQELAMGRPEAFRLEFYNSFVQGARALLEEHPPFSESIDEAPHLLFVGMGKMGESAIVHTARLWWKREPSVARRFKATIIDRTAEDKRRLLLLKHSLLDTTCELDARNMDVRSSEFLAAAYLFDSDGRCLITRAYVLLDDDSRSLSASMILLKRLRGLSVPVVARLSHEGGLATLLHIVDYTREGFGSLSAFGLLEKTCVPELLLRGTHDALAEAIHLQHPLDAGEPAQGGSAHASRWGELPPEVKARYERAAELVGHMLSSVGCTIEPLAAIAARDFVFTTDEVELLARSIHEFRMKEEARGGDDTRSWRGRLGLGPAPKSNPWEHCSEEEQEYCRQLVRNLPGLLARVDFQIYRLT